MIPKKKPTYQDLTKLMFTDGNPKTDKNKHIKDLDQYLIKRLNLAPAKISGFEQAYQLFVDVPFFEVIDQLLLQAFLVVI